MNVFKTCKNFLDKRSAKPLSLAAIFLVLLIGVLDYLSGFELSFSIFYLVPVSFVAWYTGFYPTMLVCLISAGTWFIVDFNSGHPYSHMLIPYWNAFVRLGIFVILGRLIMIIKSRLLIEEQLARHDGLTGLMNARTFFEVFSTIFDMAKRYHHPTTIAYIDLDDFKKINDRLGHVQGDEVLKKIAAVMTDQKRQTDFVARLGGDEFAVLFPETDIAGASAAMSTLRERLTQVIKTNKWPIGLSIGVASLQNTSITASEAINLADNLMYKVKKSGKNNIIFEEFTDNQPPITITD